MGGTFDPVHLGHLTAARAALACGELDRVLLVPAGSPPHKRAAVASPKDRLRMTRLAVAGESHLQVWDVEVRRRGRSYTIDTLAAFGRLRPQDEPWLILGWDAAREIGTWREPARVMATAPLLIVARPGVPEPSRDTVRAAGIDPARVRLCLEPTLDVKATEIRARAAEGLSLEGLVPAAVATHIVNRRLYCP